jgi:hypothetical protein
MAYYNNEDAKNLVKLEIENRKSALELYTEVIELVKKYDGKILNKRFETALKKIDERLSYERAYNSFYITMSCWNNRSCRSTKKDSFGYSSTIYIHGNDIRLNTYIETYSYGENPSMLNDERINADVLIEALNKGKIQIEKTIAELENSIDKVQEYKEKCEALKKEMEETTRDIPYLIKDYFNINYRVENK